MILVALDILTRVSHLPFFIPQVIFRVLGQAGRMDDPYSSEALSLLTLTNLRIRLLKPHQCPASPGIARSPHSPPQHTDSFRFPLAAPGRSLRSPAQHARSAPYAVYSLLARGTCLCHGHAEHCLSAGVGQDTQQGSTVVSDWVELCWHSANYSFPTFLA